MPRITLAGLVFLGASVAPLFAQQACQGLMSLALDHATVTSATAVPEGIPLCETCRFIPSDSQNTSAYGGRIPGREATLRRPSVIRARVQQPANR
jgi:hypothetical protein